MKKNMIGLFVSLMLVVSCGVSHKVVELPTPQVNTILVIPTIVKDTVTQDTLPKKASKESKVEYDNLIVKTNDQTIVPKDSIISLNYQWQKAYLRVVNRKIRGDDSLKNLIIEQGKKADAYYKDAKKANYYVEQTKHAEVSSNWVFYTGFVMILFFIIANTVLTYKIKKQTA